MGIYSENANMSLSWLLYIVQYTLYNLAYSIQKLLSLKTKNNIFTAYKLDQIHNLYQPIFTLL